MFESRDPSTGLLRSTWPCLSDTELERILSQLTSVWQKQRADPSSLWVQRLRRLREALRAEEDSLARHLSGEMGKPVFEARAEIAKSNELLLFAESSFDLWAKPLLQRDGLYSTHVAPLGLVLAIMPWNYPIWQTLRAAFSVWLGRNALLLKPAPNVPETNHILMRLMQEAELPAALIFSDLPQTERLISDSRVRAVTLTGSTRAGERVAELCGRFLKKVVLELGGSDPYLVFEDANLDLAAQICVDARLVNTGQSCVAAKRFLCEETIHDAFVDRVLALVQKKTLGPPLEGAFDGGPLARADLRESLHRQRDRSLAMGATEVFRTPLDFQAGYFTPISILVNVKPGMPAFDEETFGPLFAVSRFRSEAEALALAHLSRWGLGAAVFTENHERQERLLNELQAGLIAVNQAVRSHPHFPFGGVKASGLGRELGPFSPLEFANLQTRIGIL